MKYTLVATRNVQRFMDATKALEQRFADPEIMGMGLVFGKPGLGKTMAMEAYHARCRGRGRIRTVLVRAMAHWTEAACMKSLLAALGQVPRNYRRDMMFDQILEALASQPALFLIDEIDAIAGSRNMVGILKDVHDVTHSAILMVGEERVDGLLRRYESFYNRMNRSAVVHLAHHGEDDVRLVIEQRCDVAVAPDVATEIFNATGGRSMRSVIDQIRDIETFARTNGLTKIGLSEYRKMCGQAMPRTVAVFADRPALREAAHA